MSQIYQLNHAVYPPGTVVQTLTPDSGTSPVVPDASNTINVLGGTLCETVGSLNTLTINVDAAVAAQYDCDTGSAVPALNILTVAGGNNIATSGAGSTITIDVSDTTQYAVQVGSAAGALSSLALGTANQVLTSNGAGADPSWQDLPPSGLTWQVDTGVATNMVTLNGYIANNAGQTVFTLPATAAVGDTFRVTGMNNATGWKIAQNAGQTIHFGAQDTTTGATGYLESTATYDAVELVCNVANTDFIVLSVIGNVTVN